MPPMKTALFILAVQPEPSCNGNRSFTQRLPKKKALCQSSEAFCLLPNAKKNLKQPFSQGKHSGFYRTFKQKVMLKRVSMGLQLMQACSDVAAAGMALIQSSLLCLRAQREGSHRQLQLVLTKTFLRRCSWQLYVAPIQSSLRKEATHH